MSNIPTSRSSSPAARLGVAKRCLELAVGYAKQRVTFGAPQMKARHGPPHVGTMIWASRAALGAGGRNGTDK
jgi:alkylation response protein AidB-like acyl-CoA dehydrogenase